MVITCSPRKETRTESAGVKRIKAILESVHDPDPGSAEGGYQNEPSENSEIIRYTYSATDQLSMLEKFNDRGSAEQKEVFTYDRQQRLTQRTRYHLKELSSRIVNRYDDSGKLAEELEFNEEGKNIGKKVFQLEPSRITRISTYVISRGLLHLASESRIAPDNRLLETIDFTNGQPVRKEIHQYDSLGNRMATIYFNKAMEEERILQFKHDSLGRTIETLSFDKSRMIESRVVSHYDGKNNLIELITFGINGMVKERVRYQYNYDAHGNWYKRTTFNGQKPVSTVIRGIEYF